MNELHCLFGKIFAFVKSENYIPCRHWSVVASVNTDKHISLYTHWMSPTFNILKVDKG